MTLPEFDRIAPQMISSIAQNLHSQLERLGPDVAKLNWVSIGWALETVDDARTP